jgi:hypothetical protein
MNYAIVKDGRVTEIRKFSNALRPDQIKHINGVPMARPLIDRAKPNINRDTHRLVKDYSIYDDRVEIAWSSIPLDDAMKVKRRKMQLEVLEDGMLKELIFVIANTTPVLPPHLRSKLLQRDALLAQITALGEVP